MCKGGGIGKCREQKKINLVLQRKKYISRRGESVNNSGSRSVAVGVKITKKSVTNPEVTIRSRRKEKK